MDAASPQIFQAWNSSIKSGEVTDLLSDEAAVQELERVCDAINAVKIFSRFASKVFELKTKPLDVVFPRAIPIHLTNITDLFSSLYVRKKVSGDRDENFIISLYHIIEYMLKEGYYDYSLKLKRRIEEVGYGSSMKEDKQRTMVFNNLYLLFWNSGIQLENTKGDLDVVLKLRIAAVDLLSHASPSKFQAVSERIVVTSRHYVARNRDSISHDLVSKMCSDFLEIATPMVLRFLKYDCENGFQDTSVELQDKLTVSVKSYGDILTETMRVHNLYLKGREGLDLCTKYCKACCGSDDSERRFYGFLDIFCDVFSRMASITSVNSMKRKDFHEIYRKLCEIQSLSDGHAEVNLEDVYCGIKFRSLPFLKASECVCRSVIDLWEIQVADNIFSVCPGDESSLLLILNLGGKLSWVSDPSYSLKFMAFSLNVVIHMVANATEDAGFGEYDPKVMKAREILISCLSIEEEINAIKSNNSAAAINALIKVLHVSIQVFFNKKLLVICEEFLMKYHKLISKWVQSNEFSVLKDNQWWSVKHLCMCRRDQSKYRPALAALALALDSRITAKYSSVFSEWAKVKISAQLCNKMDDELKLSTVYHILKESVKDHLWTFSSEEISQFLKLELYAYLSKDVSMPSAVQDVCLTILEVSDDAILKAEAQLCLIELSCSKGPCDLMLLETAVDSEEGFVKPSGAVDPVKVSLTSCQKLIADFQNEIKNACVKDEVPVKLCILAQAYYWLYLCRSCLSRKKAKKELGGDGAIPLRVPRKVDVNGEEEILEDDASSCDVVPSQLRLKSSKQKHLLGATLNVALALWEHADLRGLKNSDCEKFNVIAILKCIEASAHIYELYDDLWHCIKAWCLLCKYGDIFMKDEVYLLGMSNLMRKGAVSLRSSFLPRADDIAAKLPSESPLLLTFLLGKCWLYLCECEFSVGLPILGKVLKNCSPSMGKWHAIIYAHAEYLLALYCLQSPVDFYSSEVSKDPVSTGCSRYDFAITALGTLIRLLGSWKDSGSLSLYTLAQVLLLDISLWIGEVFLDLNIPQEAYAHLKQQFLVAQKLLLPNRTVQFLSTLAFVDLMACNKTDCEVKLLGMESIIDLDHGKHKDERLVDIKNLIEWLTKGGETVLKSKPNSFEVYVSENESEVEVNSKDVRMYSPERPGRNYKCIQLKKCVDKCFCEWCVNSGFQKAFSGLRVVKVCLANSGEVGSFAPSSDVFENANGILRNIIRRFKLMTARMSTFNSSLVTSEAVETVDFHNGAFFGVEVGRLYAFYVRFMLNMADFYFKEWESSDASRSDLLNKIDILISVVEEEEKDTKCLFRLEFLAYHVGRLKMVLDKAKTVSCVSSSDPEDELEQEFRLWVKGKAPLEVCKTPTKEITNASQSRKVETSNLDGGDDFICDPIPSMPKRKLPQRNLALNFKKEEELLQKSRSAKVTAAPSVKIKKVVSSDPKVGKLKKDVASGIKARELTKSDSGTGKVQKVSAAGNASKGKDKSNGGESSASDANPRRRLKKL